MKDIEEASKRKAERAREIKAKGSELRTSRLEQAKERLAAGPPVSVLKGSPGALKSAIRRGQIKQISPRGGASPKSKDTEAVFTAQGTRYAKTDLYSPTLSDRATALKHRAGESATSWWDKHKTQVIIGGFAVAGAILAYNAWQGAQERNRLAALVARRGRHRSAHRSGVLAEMPRGMMGGWYEMAPGAEEASARAQIEAMYPHFETSGGWDDASHMVGWDLFHDVFGAKDPFHGGRQENRWQHHHDEHERRHDERERRHDERLRHEEWAEHPHMSGWEPWSHDDFGEEP